MGYAVSSSESTAAMFSLLFLILGTGQLALCAALARRGGPHLLPAVLAAALAYDNAVIGLGRWIGEGDLLATLNAPRFMAHAVLTPLLLTWALAVLRTAGGRWAARRGVTVVLWTIVLTLIVYSASFDVFGLSLVPERWADTVRYTNAAAPPGPPLAALITVLGVLVAGWHLWRRARSRGLLTGAILMTAVSGLAAYAPILGNLGEVALIAGILTATRPPPGDPSSQPYAGETASHD